MWEITNTQNSKKGSWSAVRRGCRSRGMTFTPSHHYPQRWARAGRGVWPDSCSPDVISMENTGWANKVMGLASNSLMRKLKITLLHQFASAHYFIEKQWQESTDLNVPRVELTQKVSVHLIDGCRFCTAVFNLQLALVCCHSFPPQTVATWVH